MKTKNTIRAFVRSAIVLSSLVAAHAWAQYPSRAITMIVPFPPGGVADVMGRPVADALSKKLGKSIVVENKGGAGGALGITQAARAQADGHTLLMALSSISILPEADRIMERKPGFTLDQFVPIARITADPTVLAVRADAPWNTLESFLEHAKKNPGMLNYGSSGHFGTMHVPVAQLEADQKVSFTHIPYTGGGPAVAALLGGQVDFLSTGPSSVVQHVKAGKIKVLAHWGESPLAAFPGVPSLKDKGINVSYVQWSGLFALKGTPPEAIDKLKSSMDEIAQSNEHFKGQISNTGSPLSYLNAPDFASFWDKDIQAMKELSKNLTAPPPAPAKK